MPGGSRPRPHGCLVAMGGSVGAIEALLSLVPLLPRRFGAPVLVAVHRRPREPFRLDRVLKRESLLDVRLAEDRDRLEPGTILVAPADRHLTLEPERVRLRAGSNEDRHRPSIDTMLRSAAHVFGPSTIGVLLSGTSTDGVAGLRAVREGGGVTVVQAAEDATFPTLPEAACRSLAVDHVLPVSAMPALFDGLLQTARSGTTARTLPG